MKNCMIGFLLVVSAFFYSCNAPSTTTDTADSTKAPTMAPDSMDKAPAVELEDPDPTDTVPAEQYGINTSSKATAALVRKALLDDIFKKDITFIDSADRKFAFSELDLNNDGKAEIFVGFKGSYYCGTGGCMVALLNPEGKKITVFSIVDDPVVVGSSVTKGWKDLIITSKGIKYLVKWDGSKYPSNPSIQPKFKDIPGDDLPRALDYFNFAYPWFRF